MHSPSTKWLFGAAVVLFAFIFFFERHWPGPGQRGRPPVRILGRLAPATITGLGVVRERDKLAVRLERTTNAWRLVEPLVYPARPVLVDTLLRELERLQPAITLSARELAARPRAFEEFGFNEPLAVVVLEQGDDRLELRFGSRTTAGDQVYLQAVGQAGVHVVDARLLDLLPRSTGDWRDPALIPLSGVAFDRVEVLPATRGFALHYDLTNRLWTLTKPWQLRADNPKVGDLLRRLFSAQIQRFVSDDPRTDLDALGLLQPDLELVLGRGTNDLFRVRFGKSPAQDPGVVHALCVGHSNVVLVSRDVVRWLSVDLSELRDRHLLSFAPPAVDQIEVLAEERFVVRQHTNRQWLVTQPAVFSADPILMRELLVVLGGLQVERFEKDVVTDFSAYGLAPPRAFYSLQSVVTNTAGVTNLELGRLELGLAREAAIFARRGGENSVYTVRPADVQRLPSASWQLRDLRVWSFTTNQVSRVTVRQNGQSRDVIRNPAGALVIAPGSQGIINVPALEEALFRLGELRAVGWVARGDEARTRLGFAETGHRIEIELRGGEKPQVLTLDFSARAPDPYPYAAVSLEGQPWIFEFPLPLYYQFVVPYLSLAPASPPAAAPPAADAKPGGP